MNFPASPAPSDQVKPVIGMVHLDALPGAPRHARPVREIVAAAVAEARLYEECGVHCVMIENMHDVPYTRGTVGPEIVAAMTVAASAVRAQISLPIGLQVLAGADLEAMAIAHAAGLDFIRVECFSFAHVADEGIFESNAARLLRYRRSIGAEAVKVWADIKKKHSSHALTADLSLGDVAEAAEFMGAETIIVTGPSTARPPSAEEIAAARARCELPVFVGSGVSLGNLAEMLAASDGLIVGSYFKGDGRWANPPDRERIRRFMDVVNGLQPGAQPPGALAAPEPPRPAGPLRISLPSA